MRIGLIIQITLRGEAFVCSRSTNINVDVWQFYFSLTDICCSADRKNDKKITVHKLWQAERL